MLPIKERLTRAGLFQRAYTARKVTNTEFFSLYVLLRTGRVPASPTPILTSNGYSTGQDYQQTDANVPANVPESTKTSLATRPTSQEIARMQSTALPLVGFVVAKKVCKSACLRNKVKRRIREAYRLLQLSDPQARQDLAQWYAMVFVIQPKAIEADWSQLRQSVTDGLAKAAAKYGTKRSPAGQNKKPTGPKRHEDREQQ